MKDGDAKTLLEIALVNLFESLEDCWNSSVREVIDSRETYFTA
jgi:hypothetical protein